MDHPAARITLLAIATAVSLPGAAQSIDIRDARATLGQPFILSLRVKGSETGTALLAPHCVEAALDGEPLRWQAAQALGDGAVRVRFAATPAIEQPWLRITAALRCGATFVREFTVLAEAPPDGSAADLGAAAATPATKTRPPTARAAPPPPTPGRASPPSPVPPQATRVAPPEMPALAPARPTSIEPAPPGPATPPAPVAQTGAASPATAHPMTAAFLALWQQDLGELKREQHQARAQMAGLHNRLERQEQTFWTAALGGLAAGVGLVLTQTLLRRLGGRRLRRMEPVATRPAESPLNASSAPVDPGLHDKAVDIPGPAAVPAPAATSGALPERPEAPLHTRHPAEASTRWLGRDFGHAEVDERRHARLFATADAMNATGYPGASLALLETAAHGSGGKGPGLLLRLLDLYRQLGQPANEERVGAELAGLYPVRPATLVNADEGRPIEAHERPWQRVVASWAQPDAPEVLAGLLTEPDADAALDLAAFRDLVFLRELSLARESMPRPTTSTGAGASPTVASDDEIGAWTLQALPG